jgi:small subunit ribosomal protein S20
LEHTLANTKSAEKRNRQALKRRARNQSVRTAVRTAIKKAREALASKDTSKIEDALRSASATLDKAASKGVLHKRNASRRIARLRHAATSAKA